MYGARPKIKIKAMGEKVRTDSESQRVKPLMMMKYACSLKISFFNMVINTEILPKRATPVETTR
jgi:hypothetical protein